MTRSRHNLVCCPECASGDVAVREPRGIVDFAMELCGSYRFRCRHCLYRFRGNPLRLTDLLFAKCPHCLSQELEAAQPELVETGRWTLIRSSLGPNKHICSHCGAIFASFRPVRNGRLQSLPIVAGRVTYRGEGPEVEALRAPQPIVQAWNRVLEARPVVVRLRIRYRPRHQAAATGQLMDRP